MQNRLHICRMAALKCVGFTLVELMISMTIGLLIALASLALLLSSKNAYTAQDEYVEIQETGRYALENITRAIHQAAFENWDKDQAPVLTSAFLSSNIQGLDANSLKSKSSALDLPVTPAVNGSDVLALRYFGAGSGLNGDGTVLNCAGFGVAATNLENAEEERGWSIYYVANDSTGEPELRCKYKGNSGWSSESIARGVESFQVVYGLDTDGDGLANRFIRAADVIALDDALVLKGTSEAARIQEKNAKSHWKKVVAIKVGILVRGHQPSRTDELTHQYDLLGASYSELYADKDAGVRIKESTLPVTTRNRLRKVFTSTIRLRNLGWSGAT
jgi:type IV pilus assembly protein PilW